MHKPLEVFNIVWAGVHAQEEQRVRREITRQYRRGKPLQLEGCAPSWEGPVWVSAAGGAGEHRAWTDTTVSEAVGLPWEVSSLTGRFGDAAVPADPRAAASSF